MKNWARTLAIAATLLSFTAEAQTLFNGTWKVDFGKSVPPKKLDVLLLNQGIYECQSCVPAFKGGADGTDQPLGGVPYFDTIAVVVKSDHEVDLTAKKKGEMVWTNRLVVSEDGNTLTTSFSDKSNTNGGDPVTGTQIEERAEKGPAGSHLVSGSWRPAKMENLSENGAKWTYKVNGQQLEMTTPTGQSYVAKLDGTDAPMKGDPGVTSVSVRMLGSNTLEETDKREGKVVSIQKMTVSEDGETAKLLIDDKIQKTTIELVAVKQ